jgi:hypothetical protein
VNEAALGRKDPDQCLVSLRAEGDSSDESPGPGASYGCGFTGGCRADGLLVADLNVDNDIYGGRDGIDPVDDHHALIERVNVWSDDDSICFKSDSQVGVEDATL